MPPGRVRLPQNFRGVEDAAPYSKTKIPSVRNRRDFYTYYSLKLSFSVTILLYTPACLLSGVK